MNPIFAKSPALTLLVLLTLSWCIMTLTHESGHLLGGYCCGAKLQEADLWPWHLPYSYFQPDPFPLVTLWSGPIFGSLLPLLVAIGIRRNWSWILAWFCLTANGLYLLAGLASNDPLLDSSRLLAEGTPRLVIFAFGLATSVTGYWNLRKSIFQHFRSANHQTTNSVSSQKQT